jgi:hypothetical protein
MKFIRSGVNCGVRQDSSWAVLLLLEFEFEFLV